MDPKKLIPKVAEDDDSILYDEVVKVLLEHGYTLDDIDWIECRERCKGAMNDIRREIPLESFIVAAKNTKWDQYSYMQQMTDSLKIYGKDRKFLIQIDDYDGRQSIEFILMDIRKPSTSKMVESFELRDYGAYDDQPKWIEN